MKNARLFTARYLLPMVAEPIEDGALLVEGGRIAAFGARRELQSASSGAELVDFGEAILLPPFANAHTHLELTNFRVWSERAGETSPPESFVDWILRLVHIKRGLAPAELAASLQAGIVQSLQAGTGAVGDILSRHESYGAYRGSPLRGRVYLEILGRTPEIFRPRFQRALDLAARQPAQHLTAGLSPHSTYSLTSAFLEEVYAVACDRGFPVSTHLAESQEEVLLVSEGRGAFAEKLFPAAGWKIPSATRSSPVVYLAERGGLIPSNLLVHGVHVDPEGIERIARSRATVVLCPRSNARLGVGKAPIQRYLRAGVPLALGTDSMASSDSLSIWDEIAFARRYFPGELSPRDLLNMATFAGAHALGMGGEMGFLTRGAGAHFQVLTPAALPTRFELEEFLCTSGRTEEISALFLDGRDVLQRA